MKEEKDIDRLFREGLKNPEIPFSEMDWIVMDKKLNNDGKRRINPVFWISTVAAIAAVLTIVFLIYKPEYKPNEQTVLKQKLNKNGNNQVAKSPDSEHINSESERINNDLPKVKNTNTNLTSVLKNALLVKSKILPNTALKNEQITFLVNDPVNTKLLADVKGQKINDENRPVVSYEPQKIKTEIDFKKSAIAVVKKSVNKPSLSLGFSAAPDLTSVQGSKQSSLSGGIGLEISLSLNKKLSISSGLAYAKKLYNSDFSLYNPNSNYVFKNKPINIQANCDVLDIPLNVNYKVLGNNKNSLIVTTGLSSYLMLKERYNYTYENEYASGPKSYQVHNQNNHLLGVANIGVTYQHKINNKFSVGISPFMKIPLTEIGYGNSKLSSAGVAVSLNMMDVFKKK